MGATALPGFVVRPYPKEWEQRLVLADGSAMFARPLRLEDERLFSKDGESQNRQTDMVQYRTL